MDENNINQPEGAPVQPQYAPPPIAPQPESGKALGIASLVCGIVSLVFIILPFIGFIGSIIAVVGIILGIIAKKQGAGGAATAGMVMSIIGLALCTIFYIACIACANAVAKELGNNTSSFADEMSRLLEGLQ